MRHKKAVIVIAAVLICLIAAAIFCYAEMRSNSLYSIAVPDNIVYYHEGISKVINPQDKGFRNIVNLTEKRLAHIRITENSNYGDDDLNEMLSSNSNLIFHYSKLCRAKFEYYGTFNTTANGEPTGPIYDEFFYTQLVFPLQEQQDELGYNMALVMISDGESDGMDDIRNDYFQATPKRSVSVQSTLFLPSARPMKSQTI